MAIPLALLLVIFIAIIFRQRSSSKNSSLNFEHINEDSFQRYAKFFGSVVPTDNEFIQKLNTIFITINGNKLTDIKEIAKISNCSLEECILKIKYLKNKRMIGDLYIDTVNFKLLPCSSEDQKLLEKYKPFIYYNHLQINEMANILPNKKNLSIKQLQEEIFQELKYLNSKSLLNGVLIDDIDRKIIYYTIEKKKPKVGYITKHCPNCGALNDVDNDGKTRCSYCQTIILGDNIENSKNKV